MEMGDFPARDVNQNGEKIMEMVQYVSRLIYEMQVWMEMFQYVSHKWNATLTNKNRLFLMPTLGA